MARKWVGAEYKDAGRKVTVGGLAILSMNGSQGEFRRTSRGK
jgi:hypothetical protein